MTVTTEPEFYDTAMTGDGEPAMLPLEDSPWLPLYDQAAGWIHPAHPVVDLGCGTGRFAELLRRRGHGPYLGVDFSTSALAEAARYVPDRDSDTDWACRWERVDLRTWQPDRDRLPTNAVFVCLETLEHLDDDVSLIRRIPVGHELIFSVPNFGGEAHLRVFQDPGDAWRRYAHLLSFTAWTLIGAGPKYFIHLYRARRRGDAW